MKLHDFCVNEQRSHALLMTYSIDPFFFEALPLQKLQTGGSRRIVVLADANQSSTCIGDAAQDLRKIGRSWTLGLVRDGACFHPKILARFNKDDAHVAIVSGNLTAGGWGRNIEIGASWHVGPKHEDPGVWLRDLVEAAKGWCPEGCAHDVLQEITYKHPWLRGAQNRQLSRTVAFSKTLPLIDAFRARFGGKRFPIARMVTGSTDEDGTFLRTLIAEFGVEQIDVFVDKDRHSFLAEKVADLPLRLLAPQSGEHLTHAKALWLSGPDGHAFVWGSANCSKAAWLLPPKLNGNNELVVMDDGPDPEILAALFNRFQGAEPFEALAEPRKFDEPTEENPPSLHLKSVRFENGIWDVRSAPTATNEIELKVQGKQADFRVGLVRTSQGLLGRYPLEEVLPTALFAQLVGSDKEGGATSNIVAVDRPNLLFRDKADDDLSSAWSRIGPEDESIDSRELALQSLIEIADAIIFEDQNSPEHDRRAKNNYAAEEGVVARPVDPIDLVSKMREHAQQIHEGKANLGFAGMLSKFDRLFFDQAEYTDTYSPPIEEPDETNLGEPLNGGSGGGKPRAANARRTINDHRTRRLVREAHVRYVQAIQNREFTTSRNLLKVHECIWVAIALPCKLSISGWISHLAAADMVREVAEILLTRGRHVGLIERIKADCRTPDELADYAHFFTNGRIWLALVSFLAEGRPESVVEAILRASITRDLFSNVSLVSTATAADLVSAFGARLREGDRLEFLNGAPNIREALVKLETALLARAPEAKRRIGRLGQKCPDLFWEPPNGWQFERGSGFQIRSDYAWHLLAQDETIELLGRCVKEAWPAGGLLH